MKKDNLAATASIAVLMASTVAFAQLYGGSAGINSTSQIEAINARAVQLIRDRDNINQKLGKIQTENFKNYKSTTGMKPGEADQERSPEQ